jgi:hypothetical protein
MHATQHAQRERRPPGIVKVAVEHGSGGTARDQVSGGVAEQASIERAAERFAREHLPFEPLRDPLNRGRCDSLIHWQDLRL